TYGCRSPAKSRQRRSWLPSKEFPGIKVVKGVGQARGLCRERGILLQPGEPQAGTATHPFSPTPGLMFITPVILGTPRLAQDARPVSLFGYREVIQTQRLLGKQAPDPVLNGRPINFDQ